MVKRILKYAGIVIFAVMAFFGMFMPFESSNQWIDPEMDAPMGVSMSDAQWVNIDKFTGYKTKSDPSKIDAGANPVGQNTVVNDGDRVSIRKFGFTPTGTASTTANGIKSLHTFRKRDGENIMLRSNSTYLEYYDETQDEWEVLKGGLTAGKKFGFADFNINADLQSRVYLGNDTDDAAYWNGAHTNFTTAATSTATILFVTDTSDFSATGTIIYCGTEVAYTAKTSTTFTVGSAHICASGKGIAEVVVEDASTPKGNIYLVSNNRLFIAGVSSSTQAVFFSAYTDASDFSTFDIIADGTDASAGIFNLGEGGGGVEAMVLDEESIYFFKKSIIYKATLNDTLYTLEALKSFDGNSQTTGVTNDGSTFTGGNEVFFITPDRQIMRLARIETVDYPQVVPISDVIKPTVNEIATTVSSGIFWQDDAYFTGQSDDSTIIDTVLIYDAMHGIWQSPIIGWSPSTWTIYDDGDGDALYFGDYNNANVHKVTDDAVDNSLGITANWRTAELDFGSPQNLKEIDNVYIEGYITDNTTISISLLLDEDGYTQTFSTDFVGTETDYIFDSTAYNVFGLHPFGFERFGSSEAAENKKFRMYLNKNFRTVPFHTMQLEFASDGVGQDWEIIRIGLHVKEKDQPLNRDIYRAFQ